MDPDRDCDSGCGDCGMANEIVFRREESYMLPRYKDFYIKDRKQPGRDRNGHETYEYALFRRRKWKYVRRFRTRKQAYMWLGKLAGITKETMYYADHSSYQDDKIVSVLLNGTIWKLDKKTRTIYNRPYNDERLTGWHEKQRECINAAKGVVRKIEEEET